MISPKDHNVWTWKQVASSIVILKFKSSMYYEVHVISMDTYISYYVLLSKLAQS